MQQLCGLTLDELFQTAYSEQAQRPELAFLPRWQTCELDLAAAYAQRMSEVGKRATVCLQSTMYSRWRTASLCR